MTRRWLAVAVLAVLVVAIPAAAADLPLRLVSQTSTKITLGWDRSDDVAAYVFYRNGQRVSHTFDGNRTSVTFSKVTGCVAACYGVEDLRSDGISSYPLAVTPKPVCSDGVDNDGDGKTDYPADPGCTSATDTDETNPAPPSGASLFVSPNGNDSSTGTQTSPVRSLGRAFQLAQCGTVVEVAAGSYGDQQILETAVAPTCTGNPIVMRAAAGTRPLFHWINFGDEDCSNTGPDNLTLKGFDVTWGINVHGNINNAVVDDFRGGSFAVGGCANNVTIKNSEWGPCDSGGGAGRDCRTHNTSTSRDGQNKIAAGPTNVVIEHNTIHDYRITDDAHFECIWVGDGTNVTFRGNHFWGCVTSAIALPDTEMAGTWLFENNWFGWNNPGNAALKFGLRGGCPSGTVIMRFNSFSDGSTIGNEESDLGNNGCGRIFIIGNIEGGEYGCIGNAVYRYNLYLNAGGCDPSDRTIPALPYVNGSELADGDYHLSIPSIADGFVPAGTPYGDLAVDRDGNARVFPKDAGADDR